MKRSRKSGISTSASRQRGSVLVLVLGVTSIVGVIGLSSLLVVRLQNRDVQSRADAAQAQQFADGVLQLIHTRLADDPDWRSTYQHDVWTADEALADGYVFRFKLEDETDTDLADDPDDAMKLLARVENGQAVRLISHRFIGSTPVPTHGGYQQEVESR
ncbi:MAG: hypothetical protein AAF593_10365 [Planctomycetota bacterium]